MTGGTFGGNREENRSFLDAPGRSTTNRPGYRDHSGSIYAEPESPGIGEPAVDSKTLPGVEDLH